MTNDIGAVYDAIFALVQAMVQSRMIWGAVLLGIGLFLIVLAITRMVSFKGFISAMLALAIGAGAFGISLGNYPTYPTKVGNELATVAISAGVSKAQDAHATMLQYIHANISVIDMVVQNCERRVNSHDFCSSNTQWYTHREINVHYDPVQKCETKTDSNGNSHQECHTEWVRDWDDEYTPWFTHIVRYYIVADTKVKYLNAAMYDIANLSEPKAKPVIYLTGWRAPENATQHILLDERPGAYDDRVPEIWDRVRKNASMVVDGNVVGKTVLATFVGNYFHWMLASEATEMQIYKDQYERMKRFVTFPAPNGATFSYKDAYGKDTSAKTDLYSLDGGVALDFRPVFNLGTSVDDAFLNQLNETAANLQGNAGPNLQASIRWFLVEKSVVEQMGGIVDTTTAIKAYLSDASVFGLFVLPKNLIIEVVEIDSANKTIVGRNMETGMPMGNVLVKQAVRMSIPAGESLPLTVENVIGSFSGHYTNSVLNGLTYTYEPELSLAGGIVGMLYEKTPDYQAPDVNSDDCETAPAEHNGFIRYQMCTQEYRKTNIRLDQKDIEMITNDALASAKSASPITIQIIILVLGVLFLGFVIYQEYQN